MREQKEPLRCEMRARLKTEAPGLASRSTFIRRQIQSHPLWKGAQTVALFCPLPGEPDLLALMEERGRRFVFPRVEGPELAWHEVSEVSELQINAALGFERLRQPVAGASVAMREIDLLLVPGLAFTREGGRLGRGGGYYDRVLAKMRSGAGSIGVCFEFQVMATLPLEEHDLLVHDVCIG
jgi:5-formyltetrahydrofolate cyclo-ligase